MNQYSFLKSLIPLLILPVIKNKQHANKNKAEQIQSDTIDNTYTNSFKTQTDCAIHTYDGLK